MKVEKQTDSYTIFKRNDGRFAIKDSNKKPINGEEKAKILADEGLIKLTAPAPKEEAPAEDAPAEEGGE